MIPECLIYASREYTKNVQIIELHYLKVFLNIQKLVKQEKIIMVQILSLLQQFSCYESRCLCLGIFWIDGRAVVILHFSLTLPYHSKRSWQFWGLQ